MTDQEAKRIADQIADLESQLREHHRDKGVKEILQVEQKYLGKTYKKEVDEKVVYLKVMSAISNGAPYAVQCLEFEYPINVRFRHRGDFLGFRGYRNPFDFGFENDLFLFSEEELLARGIDNTYEEISNEEFDRIFDEYLNQLKELMKKTYTIEGRFGGEYVQKILKEA